MMKKRRRKKKLIKLIHFRFH
ncbi:hypothetical protein Goshw_007707 [Gossypium schwendimanii]|uniref:Uncharacterized protein n=1 Tax=Gossypium schwendimanii TaxID=34291 RepID=A0A7J9MGI8_GOSSC|nr:hypothetical protein [Gossypium schwendimanii]